MRLLEYEKRLGFTLDWLEDIKVQNEQESIDHI
jgi:hypothetical protein